ncbi:hypothetical protein INQ23_27940, partial [Escherichia coli]|nr:hypothetical protein [Escherichia coli]
MPAVPGVSLRLGQRPGVQGHDHRRAALELNAQTPLAGDVFRSGAADARAVLGPDVIVAPLEGHG